MEEQNSNFNSKRTTIVGVALILLAAIVAIMASSLSWTSMSKWTSMSDTTVSSQERPSETMHFTPGFHHIETSDESEYLNALTEIDAYGADGSVEIVDISIVYSASTVTPHYHITYKVWLN